MLTPKASHLLSTLSYKSIKTAYAPIAFIAGEKLANWC